MEGHGNNHVGVSDSTIFERLRDSGLQSSISFGSIVRDSQAASEAGLHHSTASDLPAAALGSNNPFLTTVVNSAPLVPAGNPFADPGLAMHAYQGPTSAIVGQHGSNGQHSSDAQHDYDSGSSHSSPEAHIPQQSNGLPPAALMAFMARYMPATPNSAAEPEPGYPAAETGSTFPSPSSAYVASPGQHDATALLSSPPHDSMRSMRTAQVGADIGPAAYADGPVPILPASHPSPPPYEEADRHAAGMAVAAQLPPPPPYEEAAQYVTLAQGHAPGSLEIAGAMQLPPPPPYEEAEQYLTVGSGDVVKETDPYNQERLLQPQGRPYAFPDSNSGGGSSMDANRGARRTDSMLTTTTSMAASVIVHDVDDVGPQYPYPFGHQNSGALDSPLLSSGQGSLLRGFESTAGFTASPARAGLAGHRGVDSFGSSTGLGGGAGSFGAAAGGMAAGSAAPLLVEDSEEPAQDELVQSPAAAALSGHPVITLIEAIVQQGGLDERQLAKIDSLGNGTILDQGHDGPAEAEDGSGASPGAAAVQHAHCGGLSHFDGGVETGGEAQTPAAGEGFGKYSSGGGFDHLSVCDSGAQLQSADSVGTEERRTTFTRSSSASGGAPQLLSMIRTLSSRLQVGGDPADLTSLADEMFFKLQAAVSSKDGIANGDPQGGQGHIGTFDEQDAPDWEQAGNLSESVPEAGWWTAVAGKGEEAETQEYEGVGVHDIPDAGATPVVSAAGSAVASAAIGDAKHHLAGHAAVHDEPATTRAYVASLLGLAEGTELVDDGSRRHDAAAVAGAAQPEAQSNTPLSGLSRGKPEGVSRDADASTGAGGDTRSYVEHLLAQMQADEQQSNTCHIGSAGLSNASLQGGHIGHAAGAAAGDDGAVGGSTWDGTSDDGTAGAAAAEGSSLRLPSESGRGSLGATLGSDAGTAAGGRWRSRGGDNDDSSAADSDDVIAEPLDAPVSEHALDMRAMLGTRLSQQQQAQQPPPGLHHSASNSFGTHDGGSGGGGAAAASAGADLQCRQSGPGGGGGIGGAMVGGRDWEDDDDGASGSLYVAVGRTTIRSGAPGQDDALLAGRGDRGERDDAGRVEDLEEFGLEPGPEQACSEDLAEAQGTSAMPSNPAVASVPSLAAATAAAGATTAAYVPVATAVSTTAAAAAPPMAALLPAASDRVSGQMPGSPAPQQPPSAMQHPASPVSPGLPAHIACLLSQIHATHIQASDDAALAGWLLDCEREATAMGVGQPERVLAALARRALGPPQPPGAPGTQAEWVRAALLSASSALGAVLPAHVLAHTTPEDRHRAENLAPFLTAWARGPRGPVGPPALQQWSAKQRQLQAQGQGSSAAAAALMPTAAPAAMAGPAMMVGAGAALQAPSTQHKPVLSGVPVPGTLPSTPGTPGFGPGLEAGPGFGVAGASRSPSTASARGPMVGQQQLQGSPQAHTMTRMAALQQQQLRHGSVLFGGLLYTDGVDALRRPVIVVNTGAPLPPGHSLDAVLDAALKALEPFVVQPYCVVVVNISPGPLVAAVPSTWALGAYRRLARPYRKNVKHIVVVQPSTWARMMLFLSRPFVSAKAADKVKKLESITDITEATGGEVDMRHLGNAFLTFLQTGVVPRPPVPGQHGLPQAGSFRG